MIKMNFAVIGVWLDDSEAERRRAAGRNVFESYALEIMRSYGVPFRIIEHADELASNAYDIIVSLVDDGTTSETFDKLWAYAETGGTLIAYGGLEAFRRKLGIGLVPVSDRDIYAVPPAYMDIALDADTIGIRALSAAAPWAEHAAVSAVEGWLCSQPSGQPLAPLIQTVPIGRGQLIRWAVNVPDAVVRLQQGNAPVVEDGSPAPDGSANLDEGILKADDGMTLDWMLDRKSTETGMPYFYCAHADVWKEMMISHLAHTGLRRGVAVPMIDFWPAGIRQIAMISHDSDDNLDEHAATTLEVLEEAGVRTTWCMLEPGYSRSIYREVSKRGHELAFHYNALAQDNGRWGEDEFRRQLDFIRQETGVPIVSNKNHYTRFEGWGELFRWCEASGIAADQTRGPSKRGNVGSLFGTCHPYFPIAWLDDHNRLYDVVEIGFLTQDIEFPGLADSTIIRPLLEETRRRRGVAHFLFHQRHIHRIAEVREALREVVRQAEAMGFVFWTGRQVNDWTRLRRAIGLEPSGDRLEIRKPPGGNGEEAVILVPVAPADAADDGAEAEGAATSDTVERYGIRFAVTVVEMR